MMNKRLIGFLGAGCILAGLPCAASARLLSVQVAHVPKFTKLAQDMGPANPLQLLTLAVHLRYPDERAVQRFVDKVTDPRSPTFGAFLTPGQFTKSFDPTGHTYSTVEYVLTGAGGSLLETFVNNKILVIGMPVVIADVLFGTSIDQYSFGGTTYYANKTPAYLPSLLKGLVRSVNGFTDYSTRGANPAWPLGAPGIGPVQIETAYDEPIAVNPHMNGSGTTIAIATAGDYFDSDVAGYWSTYGVTRTGSLTRIPVSGSQGLRRRGMPHARAARTRDDTRRRTDHLQRAGRERRGLRGQRHARHDVRRGLRRHRRRPERRCRHDVLRRVRDRGRRIRAALRQRPLRTGRRRRPDVVCGVGRQRLARLRHELASLRVSGRTESELGRFPGQLAIRHGCRRHDARSEPQRRHRERARLVRIRRWRLALLRPARVPGSRAQFGRPQGAQRPGRRPRRGPRHPVRLLLRGFVATNGRRNERRRAQPRGPLRADRSGTRLPRGPRSERALSRLRHAGPIRAAPPGTTSRRARTAATTP